MYFVYGMGAFHGHCKKNAQLYLSCVWLSLDLRHERTPERLVFRIDWIMCSKFVNQSRLNSQLNWGDLNDH